jgi:hypothetical protein
MFKSVVPICLVVLLVALQAGTGHAEEITRVPLSSEELEAYKAMADGEIEQLSAGAPGLIVSILALIGLVTVIVLLV